MWSKHHKNNPIPTNNYNVQYRPHKTSTAAHTQILVFCANSYFQCSVKVTQQLNLTGLLCSSTLKLKAQVKSYTVTYLHVTVTLSIYIRQINSFLFSSGLWQMLSVTEIFPQSVLMRLTKHTSIPSKPNTSMCTYKYVNKYKVEDQSWNPSNNILTVRDLTFSRW